MKPEEEAELSQLASLANKYPTELRLLALALNQQNQPEAFNLQEYNDAHPLATK